MKSVSFSWTYGIFSQIQKPNEFFKHLPEFAVGFSKQPKSIGLMDIYGRFIWLYLFNLWFDWRPFEFVFWRNFHSFEYRQSSWDFMAKIGKQISIYNAEGSMTQISNRSIKF